MSIPYPLWRLGEEDADAAGGLLSRAFIDDPLFPLALPHRAAG